jgi:hypothetical protein
MRVERWTLIGALLLTTAAPAAGAGRRGLDVEVWTDRGNEAVYQPGDAMEVRVRTSDDAYLLVYELDSEGRVNLLFPDHGSRGYVEGRQTLRVPSERSNLELVVEGSAGEGYVVAIASTEPLRDLPWYLRPLDMRAMDVGYEGTPDQEEGITREGQIVGDPFVAMERIRRRVLATPDDPNRFATAYSTYFVHHEVRYPRYLCNDCHRPGRWAWWDDFDPYYSRCSVFDFRVNWNWGWGPGYWFGSVPYYYYVYRPDCPPRYRVFSSRSGRHSSWDGWGRWNSLWGGNLRRYKSDPPVDYIPPARYKERNAGLPPGFFSSRTVARGRHEGGLTPVKRDRRELVQDKTGESPSRRPILDRSAAPQRPAQDGSAAPPRTTRTWRDPGTPAREREGRPDLEGSRESLRRDTSPPDRSPGRSAESRKEVARPDRPRGRSEPAPRVEQEREEKREEKRAEPAREKSKSGDSDSPKEKRPERPPRGKNGGSRF